MFGLISVSRFILAAFTINLVFASTGGAQHRVSIDVQEWPFAEVVLFSGETISGSLTYHHQQEIISVQQKDGSLRSFSPVNVDHFIVRNTTGNNNEQQVYVTYQWDQNKPYADFKKPTFFQQLNHGHLTLIMRESYVRRDASNLNSMSNRYTYIDPYYNSMGSRFIEQVVPMFYLLLPNGEIKTLRNLHKDLFQFFGKKGKDIKDFIRKNRYSYEKPEDLIAIIDYYNSLQH